MTMFTPVGSGGRRRGRSRSRRRWPKVVAVLAVLAAVAGGAYVTWRWFHDDAPSPSAARPVEVCRTPTLASPKSVPPADAVSVEVANGTARPGLAVDTADALAADGFDITDIGNTARPLKTGVAQVRYAGRDLASALTVASYVPGSELLEVPKTKSATVLLWLGPDFDKVISSRQAEASSVVLPAQKPICHTPTP
ncbi:MAG: LytR C-terminal domain-containing protein [Actinomycetes bacterium]